MISIQTVRNQLSKNLSILILSVLLGLSSLVFADHLHGTTTEEIHCKLCGQIGAALTDETTSVAINIPKRQKVKTKHRSRLSRLDSFAHIKELRRPAVPPLTSINCASIAEETMDIKNLLSR